MAKVEVASVPAKSPEAANVFENLDKARQAVEEHAYHVAARGRDHDFENWLLAERELYVVPPCELVEQNGEFRVRAAVPGLEAKQLRLTALPGTIVIEGDPRPAKDVAHATTHFSEFNPRNLLRRIDLPKPIDAGSVKAKLERGILEVVAPKQANGAAKPKAKAKPRAAAASKSRETREPALRKKAGK